MSHSNHVDGRRHTFSDFVPETKENEVASARLRPGDVGGRSAGQASGEIAAEE